MKKIFDQIQQAANIPLVMDNFGIDLKITPIVNLYQEKITSFKIKQDKKFN